MTREVSRIRRRKKRKLTQQIEREISTPQWSPLQDDAAVDPLVFDHLNHFLKTWNDLPSLEGTSLLTPESARAALAKFTEVNNLLEERLKTVAALKQLLTTQRR